LNEFHNPVEPPSASWNSQSHARFETEMDQADEIGKVETTKLVIVGDVQEDCVWATS
jgi:hypothetical protein